MHADKLALYSAAGFCRPAIPTARIDLLRHSLHFHARRLTWRLLVNGFDSTKRIMDVAGSAAALLILAPVFLVIALLVRLDGGSVFFCQTRVGRFGREFKMYKFRSMRQGADRMMSSVVALNQHAAGVTFKAKRDPRITPAGRWLRRFSLDELPQLYNILIGDMSLVGPRPPVPSEVARYSLADRRRLEVKPGLTCLWQINGRAEIDFSGQVLLDVRYIENQSLREDLRILVRTIPAVLAGRGAY